MKNLKIQDIPKDKYEGYLWYSDAVRPVMFIGGEELAVSVFDGRFIIEGLLWSKASHMSYRIAFHDGEQQVYACHVSEDDLEGNDNVVPEDYLAHRMPGVSRLSFLRYWFPCEDVNCEHFDVMMPGDLVFVGFNNVK